MVYDILNAYTTFLNPLTGKTRNWKKLTQIVNLDATYMKVPLEMASLEVADD